MLLPYVGGGESSIRNIQPSRFCCKRVSTQWWLKLINFVFPFCFARKHLAIVLRIYSFLNCTGKEFACIIYRTETFHFHVYQDIWKNISKCQLLLLSYIGICKFTFCIMNVFNANNRGKTQETFYKFVHLIRQHYSLTVVY